MPLSQKVSKIKRSICTRVTFLKRSLQECTFDLMRASKLYALYFVNIVLALRRYGSFSSFLRILLYTILILGNKDCL